MNADETSSPEIPEPPETPKTPAATETLAELVERLGPPPPEVVRCWCNRLSQRPAGEPVFAGDRLGREAWTEFLVDAAGHLQPREENVSRATSDLIEEDPIGSDRRAVWIESLSGSLGLTDWVMPAIETSGPDRSGTAAPLPDDSAPAVMGRADIGLADIKPSSRSPTDPTGPLTGQVKNRRRLWIGVASSIGVAWFSWSLVPERTASPVADQEDSTVGSSSGAATTVVEDVVAASPDEEPDLGNLDLNLGPPPIPEELFVRSAASGDASPDDSTLLGAETAMPSSAMPLPWDSEPERSGGASADEPLETSTVEISQGDVSQEGVASSDEEPAGPVSADFLSVSLDATDRTDEFPVSVHQLGGNGRLRIDVEGGPGVEHVWAQPIDASSPRRTRGVVVFYVGDPSDPQLVPPTNPDSQSVPPMIPGVAVRMDVRVGAKLTIRRRYALRTSAAVAWQDVTLATLQQYATRIANQAVAVDREAAMWSERKGAAGSRQRAMITARIDALKAASGQLAVTGERVARLLELVERLQASARIDVTVSRGDDVLLTTREPPSE